MDLEINYRHYDGDFFRAWDIAGNVVIHGNQISDAFNAIHFFNRVDRLEHGISGDKLHFNEHHRSSVNILIEDNTFVGILDNVFEQEDYAANWVIRHNRIVDCFRPFSFELEHSAFFEVYGNRGKFTRGPSLQLSKKDQDLFDKADSRQRCLCSNARVRRLMTGQFM